MEGGKEECAVGCMVGNSNAILGRHALIMSINWSTMNGRRTKLTYYT
jgi:hypothetical protein